MTSKHLFFKAMKEDIRHKLWMVALSVLGNFLVLTVGWMIWRSNALSFWGGAEGLMQRGDTKVIAEFQEEITEFFVAYMVTGGGIIAIAGAVITGLFSFRYLFHKNMVDTCHSLPIKRDTLYGVKYVNGILIWFIPFFVSVMLTFAMACSLLWQVEGECWISDMTAGMVFNLFFLTVVYLLVYHVALAAVMLSGNILNTLVSMMILGFAAVVFYGLGVACFDGYMGTFYKAPVELGTAAYGSPLFSAILLLILRLDEVSLWEVWKALLINAGVMAALGAGSWLLYRNRASEAAEQGIWNRTVAFLFRAFLGVAAGMCGWGLFVMLVSDSRALGWGIFGAVLVGVCTFGVLDIIFQMDFKAFFAHRIQMAGTVAVSLLICFAFYWDWFGYDTRLPEPEEIAELALYDSNLANSYYSHGLSDGERFEGMHCQDREAIYAFLERMVEHERKEGYQGDLERVGVKVTLDSGRSYYRYYWMRKEDKDVAWPLLTSEAYLRSAYLIDSAVLNGNTDISLRMGGETCYEGKIMPEMRSVVEMYNQEILEEPDKVLMKEGRLAAEIALRTYYKEADGVSRWTEIYMEIYDSMERTLEALRAAGFEVPDTKKLGIHCFVLSLDCDENTAPEERVAMARELYGVPGQTEGSKATGTGDPGAAGLSETGAEGMEKSGAPEAGAEGMEAPESPDAGAEGMEESGMPDAGAEGMEESGAPDAGAEGMEAPESSEAGAEGMEAAEESETGLKDTEAAVPVEAMSETYFQDRIVSSCSIQITDREEMEELMGLLSFSRNTYSNSIFEKDFINVMSIMEDGSVRDWYLPVGALPEKYMLRFGK